MLVDDILKLLDETEGNAPVVAERLSISPSYAHRIKREMWERPEPEPQVEDTPKKTTAIIPTPNDVLLSLAPNLPAVQGLRDETITTLREMIVTKQISPAALTKLLTTLLRYENTVNELAQPTLNLYDQRQINVFSGLVDELTGLAPERLRALAGIDEPPEIVEVIEHE